MYSSDRAAEGLFAGGCAAGAQAPDAQAVPDAASVPSAATSGDAASLPTAAIAERLLAIEAQLRALAAERARLLAAFDARGDAAADGAASTASWLRRETGVSGAEAAGQVAQARTLRGLPLAAAALAAGEIGTRHVAALARAAGQVGIEAVRAAEPALVGYARDFDAGRFEKVVRRFRYVADPDGAADEADRTHGRRFLHLSATWQGMVSVSGMLDPVAGARVQQAIGALSAPLPEETRTAAQRRADALDELARRALATGELPETGGERPQLLVRLDLPALMQTPYAEPADLDGIGPIVAATLERLGCDATLVRAVMAGPSQVLDAGRAHRLVSGALRRALVARDGACIWPGCDRPAAWCEAHHFRHWSRGGPTDQDNCGLICGFHHRLAHEGGWTLTRARDGTVTARGPNGRVLCQPARKAWHGGSAPGRPPRPIAGGVAESIVEAVAERDPPTEPP